MRLAAASNLEKKVASHIGKFYRAYNLQYLAIILYSVKPVNLEFQSRKIRRLKIDEKWPILGGEKYF